MAKSLLAAHETAKILYIRTHFWLRLGLTVLVVGILRGAMEVEGFFATALGLCAALLIAYGGLKLTAIARDWALGVTEDERPSLREKRDEQVIETVNSVETKPTINVERNTYITVDEKGQELRRETKVVDTQVKAKTA